MSTTYPLVLGDRVIFGNTDCDEAQPRVRPLRPMLVSDVDPSEFHWLAEHARAPISVDCGYQGFSSSDYDLVYNDKTRSAAIRWYGRLFLRAEDTVAVRFYDALTSEVERLRQALEGHGRGVDSGWGDAEVPGKVCDAQRR